ncbi:MAG TPA: nitrate- and nitrite sensing domain-containing protein [Streptosporangiaceae bacterium]|nr:nitrate- and nitrite sensing domain-containing protein [Streptosporangiaceae bacterium]
MAAPVLAVAAANGQQVAQPAPPASRRALKNWRVRSRLLLLITIPTLAALVLGLISIVTSTENAISYQRVERLANLSSSITGLASALEDERDQTVLYIAEGSNGRAGTLAGGQAAQGAAPSLALVTGQYALTKPWLARVRPEVAGIGAGYPVQVQDDAQNILAQLNDISAVRKAAEKTNLPAPVVVTKYTSIVDTLLAMDDNIALSAGDQSLATDVRALGLVSRIIEETSEQRALLEYAVQSQAFGPGVLTGLTAAQAEENANVQQFEVAATPQQVDSYNTTVSGSLVDNAALYEDQAIDFDAVGESLKNLPFGPDDVNGAFSNGPIADQRLVEQRLVAQTISRASALRDDAMLTAAGVGAAVLIVLLLALLLTTVVGRSMVRPLRRLRSGALEVAGVRLPETVRQMSDSDGAGVPLDIDPIEVDSADEIGEVARAFDQVHREALRLASNEAALRGNVNAMFVNLSRRSQSLVERQIRLIDDLEQGEQDPDRLSSLFQMDHLATRMRRNSENLLVLAGHDATRRWNQPVALVDVLRAAVSEIEQYERVTLNVQPGIAVRGHAVNDVVHLLAELAENATSFSSAETPVVVAGHLLSSGGVLLDITDQGVGMGAEEMAHANWRLDNPPVVDVAVSRRMGLFVVARLAARHGIRVRLRPASAGGLTALVWLPDEVISHDSLTVAPGPLRFDTPLVAGSATGAATAEDVLFAGDLEVDGADAPRFAAAQAELESNGRLVRRVPGAGPRPGASPSWGAAQTGPLPTFRSSPQMAEPDAGTAPEGADAAEYAQPEPHSTSPLPALDLAEVDLAAADLAAAGLGADLGAADLGAAPASDGGHDGPAPADMAPSAAALSTGRPEHGVFGRESSNGDVVVPAAGHVAAENRLPIFEAVESDWFRRGRTGMSGWPGPHGPATAEAPQAPEVNWTSPADEGWEAAAAVSSPATGGTTAAGLPKRVPQANLVPGAAPPEPVAPAPARSAAATRERFSSFQRGSREGRAAAHDDDGPDQEDSSG